MQLKMKLAKADIDQLRSAFYEAMMRLAHHNRLPRESNPKRYGYVNLTVYGPLQGKQQSRISGGHFGPGMNDFTLIRVVLNEDYKTGGYQITIALADDPLFADLKAEIDDCYRENWKDLFEVEPS